MGVEIRVHINQKGVEQGIGPFTHGSAVHTDIMKTQSLLQALSEGGFDAAFGGARRDEERSRAKERIYSFRENGNSPMGKRCNSACVSASWGRGCSSVRSSWTARNFDS